MTNDNKVALVTGANRGIGFDTCRLLAQKGFHSVLTSRNKEKGEDAVEKLKDEGLMLYYEQLDVTDESSIQNVKKKIEQKFERLDILINNAAICYDNWQRTASADLEIVQEALNTNLLGPWRMCKAFIPMMRRQGYGRIVNVSSGDGSFKKMEATTPAYGVSKAALNALTVKLAAELTGTGILVNAVDPGWTQTDMGGSDAPKSPQKAAEGVVWAATLPYNGPTGNFLKNQQVIEW